MQEMMIRLAQESDLPRVAEFYRLAVGQPGCTWDEEYPTMENALFDYRSAGLYVCESRGEVIGVVSVVTGENLELNGLSCWKDRDGAKPAEIARITVCKSFQGRGIARRMLAELFESLRSRGFSSIRLLVAKCNPAATMTYRKLGFAFHMECEMYGHSYWACEKIFNTAEEP